MKNLHFHILFLLAISFTCISSQAQNARKRVAVVLSGGGAKGMAHIGMLKVLEKAGIPVDIVTGTSMGSIVGGLYSIGYSADELDSLVHKQDWAYILSDNENLSHQSLEARKKQNTYILQRSISSKSRKINTASGFIRGKNLTALFRNLAHNYNDSIDFSTLPIPFACVATDIVNNTEYDFHSGVLAEAMRASMSIPGVFEPIRKNNMVLVDGGLRNNYPADIARQMGADYIIGCTVQDPPKTADDLNSTAAILGQIIDVNCKNKYYDNLAITNIPIRVNTKPYNAASFNTEAIDTLIRRGEEETMKHWNELMELKKKLGLPADYKPKRIAFPRPQSMDKEYKINLFIFKNMTAHDEKFLRIKFHLNEGDSINLKKAEQITTSMRMDLFYNNANYELNKHANDYQITFEAGEKKTAQLSLGARFDNEEIAALQMNAEIPLRTAIPVSLDLTLRLGKRIKAVAEAIYHPVSFTKMRLSYEYNYNDVNVYEEGARLYNTTYNYHAINWTLLDFNIRNFNVTVGTRWDYYHHGDLLAEIKQIKEGALEVPKDDHYYSYQLRTKYDSENDDYFPTKGAWFRAGYGYYTNNFIHYHSHAGFSVVDAAWRMSFPINNRLILQPMVYGRFLFGSEIPHMEGNVIGGNFFGHYITQQMPFAGIGHVEFTDNHFAAIQLKVQENIFKHIYIIAKSTMAEHTNQLSNFFESRTMWGTQIGGYYKSSLGPLGLNFGWSNHTNELYAYFNLGYEF